MYEMKRNECRHISYSRPKIASPFNLRIELRSFVIETTRITAEDNFKIVSTGRKYLLATKSKLRMLITTIAIKV